MIFECVNCGHKVVYVVRDKVWNQLVCEKCKDEALELGVRLSYDFEEID